MRKRVFSIFISLCMVFCFVPLVQVSSEGCIIDKEMFREEVKKLDVNSLKIVSEIEEGKACAPLNKEGTVVCTVFVEGENKELQIGPAKKGNEVCLPADSSDFFGGLDFKKMDLNGLNTANVTNMSRMFQGCENLLELNLGDLFITDNVTDMFGMFSGCKSLINLDVSKFDTSQVTDMSMMFSGCESLTNLDVSRFDTSQVTDMKHMFRSCESLTNLDVSGFSTGKVADMLYMFSYCENLINLDVSKFDTSRVTDMNNMFHGCGSLRGLDVSKFDTSQVTNMSLMFNGCKGLTNLDVSKFDTSQVTNMSLMFHGCEGLTTLDVSNFNTSQVTDMHYMFSRNKNIKSLDLSLWNVQRTTDVNSMFYGCESLETLNIHSWYFRSVEDIKDVFCFNKYGVHICCTDDFWEKYCLDPEATGGYTPIHHNIKDGDERCECCGMKVGTCERTIKEEEGITWTEDSTASGKRFRVGLKNEGQFPVGGIFHVRYLDGSGSKSERDAYDEHYKNLDVSENADNITIFELGVEWEGKEIEDFDYANVLVELVDGLTADNVKAAFVSPYEDEKLGFSIVNGVDEAHPETYAMLNLKHFSPYALYSEKFNEDNGGGSGDDGGSGSNSVSTGEGSKTGDTTDYTMLYVMGAMLILSAGAVVVLKKRGKSSK